MNLTLEQEIREEVLVYFQQQLKINIQRKEDGIRELDKQDKYIKAAIVRIDMYDKAIKSFLQQ